MTPPSDPVTRHATARKIAALADQARREMELKRAIVRAIRARRAQTFEDGGGI